jgi:hypothetical protein
MWKANQSHGLHISKFFLSTPFTGPLKTATKPKKKKKKNIPTNLVIHHILKPTWKNFHQKCVRERERETFGTKVCMYVCM